MVSKSLSLLVLASPKPNFSRLPQPIVEVPQIFRILK